MRSGFWCLPEAILSGEGNPASAGEGTAESECGRAGAGESRNDCADQIMKKGDETMDIHNVVQNEGEELDGTAKTPYKMLLIVGKPEVK